MVKLHIWSWEKGIIGIISSHNNKSVYLAILKQMFINMFKLCNFSVLISSIIVLKVEANVFPVLNPKKATFGRF